MHRSRSDIRVAAAIAIPLLGLTAAQASAKPVNAVADAHPSEGLTSYDELHSEIESTGSVEAIVTLDVPTIAEGELDERARMRQRDQITAAQDAFAAAVGVDGDGEGAEISHRYRTFAGLVLELDEGGLAALESHAAMLRSVTPNRLFFPTGTGNELIGAPDMWNQGHTGTGSTVAIIDTGVDASDDRFSDGQGGIRVIAEACFAKYCPNGEKEMFGAGAAEPFAGVAFGDHGTEVAATVAGSGGVAPDADILAVKIGRIFSGSLVADCPFDEPVCVVFDTVQLLQAVDHLVVASSEIGFTTVNLSASLDPVAGLCLDSSFREPIQHLRSQGIAFVVASGNDDDKAGISEPGCVPEAIAVGATEGNSLTDLTVTSYSNSDSGLDYVAPTGSALGTSFATPRVTGAYLLLGDAYPEATLTDIDTALTQTGYPVTDVNAITAPVPQLGAALELLARIHGDCLPDPATGTVCVDDSPRPEPDRPDIGCPEEPNLILAHEIDPDALGVRTVIGTPCDDVIYGTNQVDDIYGLEGDDEIHALGGNDTIDGGEGDDTITALAGDNEIVGGFGDDQITTGAGRDDVDGGEGNDTIDVGEGDDHVTGDWGKDDIRGGPGDDKLDGEGQRDILWGGEGDDILYGSHDTGNDTMYGGAGNDVILGEGGHDHLEGNLGEDAVWGGEGNDTVELTEDENNHPLEYWADIDTVDCEAGTDIVWFHLVDAHVNCEVPKFVAP